ncbi:ABC transporter substrate-binding protein [Ramlibacter sp. WS9]|uniref:ABC transporter substrate-binding protein n=1 Tax=Ramlibacter sp. WS9 TaxID=1882741 RepID=UPI001144A62D|nr:ABC transporter substrate-binding protein [Ramlibacter sp. WS9]ROZ64560.1 ABC transporter substrate-binding protein [Ramlibacter sp. WS9]
MSPRLTLAIAVLCLAAGTAQAQQQGVSKNEIVIGTIQDLSGPIAGYGKQARNGMQLRVDEANEQGGVYDRKLRLAVEDSAYDPKRAILAAQKLVNQDKIFMLVGHIGTAQNNAVMPILFERNIVNYLPLTASKDMYEPHHKLKYALFASYYDQMRLSVPKLAKDKNIGKVCAIYQDDDFGAEVLKGAEDGLKSIGKEMVEKTSFKRGAADFSSQVAKMKASGCEMVVMGTIIRETVGTMAEARKTGFNPVFIASFAAYSDLIHKLGGKAVEGFYATMSSQTPYTDEQDLAIRFWANKYKTKFNEDPTVMSVYGYTMVDMFIKAARKTGPQLTTDNFIKAMDLSTFPPDSFGSPKMTYSSTRRLGTEAMRLSQIVDGRWKVVSDYVSDPRSARAAVPSASTVKTTATRS